MKFFQFAAMSTVLMSTIAMAGSFEKKFASVEAKYGVEFKVDGDLKSDKCLKAQVQALIDESKRNSRKTRDKIKATFHERGTRKVEVRATVSLGTTLDRSTYLLARNPQHDSFEQFIVPKSWGVIYGATSESRDEHQFKTRGQTDGDSLFLTPTSVSQTKQSVVISLYGSAHPPFETVSDSVELDRKYYVNPAEVSLKKLQLTSEVSPHGDIVRLPGWIKNGPLRILFTTSSESQGPEETCGATARIIDLMGIQAE